MFWKCPGTKGAAGFTHLALVCIHKILKAKCKSLSWNSEGGNRERAEAKILADGKDLPADESMSKPCS
jgi:hypothetical protein